MFIVGDNGYSYKPEIVSLREGGHIPDCLTDLSDPLIPNSRWICSAGGALPEAGTQKEHQVVAEKAQYFNMNPACFRV